MVRVKLLKFVVWRVEEVIVVGRVEELIVVER